MENAFKGKHTNQSCILLFYGRLESGADCWKEGNKEDGQG